MSTTTVDQAPSDDPAPPPSLAALPGDGSRVALLLFVLVEIAAIPVFLWIGRDQWFFLDEWDFLATRDGGSIDDLLTPHNEHWTTLPIVVYRLLFNVFGLHTYLPYQLVPVLSHIAVAALIFVIMRRVAVNAWIAMAAASLFALFGSGSQNVIWAFQITFVGAVMFGLLQIVLADHDGPVNWRDVVAIGAGLLALMCSGVGLTMLFVVGVAMLLGRGWRRAALQVVPLGVVYGAWFVVYGEGQGNEQNSSTPAQIAEFAVEGLRATYREMGQLPGFGIVMALSLAGGIFLVWRRWGVGDALRRYAVPITLLVSSILFIASAGATRADMLGTSFAQVPRYLYVLAAMSLPAIAVAVDAIARRWPITFPLGLALFLLPIPFSIYGARDQNPNLRGAPTVVVVPDMDDLEDVPPDTVLVARTGRSELRLDWLRQAEADGRVPDLPDDEVEQAKIDWRFRLALVQTTEPNERACRPVGPSTRLKLSKGDSFGIQDGPVQIFNAEPGGSAFNSSTYYWQLGQTLEVVTPTADLNVRSLDPFQPASVCL